ncbi:AMIN-like domain-containing (lipo)protein [Ornithinimicrobium murale]|uniref:AMIN-like domain-containing (lipo)protein n=1 Tax=Ornithinimicrobium murale TaxID=1050153 RepID=UPI001EE118EF|nr:hypothetical protein [Ornithinimicrobium murale]
MHTTARTPATRARRGWAAAGLAALLLAAAPPAPGAGTNESASLRSLTTAVSSPLQSSPYCGIYWGSLGRTNGTTHTTGTVEGVRAGRHTCFDRLVIDVANVPRSLTYDVRYVDAVRADGSGRLVPLAGAADLQIVLRAPAYADGSPTYSPTRRDQLVNVTGWDTFRQIALAGSFEGQTTVGLGVRARLPFRVLVLDGPGDGARLVVDVAHRW